MFEKENHEWGVKREIECLPYIKEILGQDVTHDIGTFNDFDFFTDYYNIELKSRTISRDCFDTTYTTPIKREKANKSNKPVIWLFSFTDGLYYLHFQEYKEIINKLEVEICNTRYGQRRNINIPVSILKPFDKNYFRVYI